ncbi:MAG: glycosyltransferase family 2 protein [bacterium]|nr:glycosyltransferase family 2 protein [bacterium]
MKDINIVFLNYLSKDNVLNALSSLVADIQNCPFDAQITVTDNSQNKDGIKDELAQKFSQVKYIDCGGNIGFGKGNNIGFANTPARYYFALNPDTIIPDNSKTIERIIRFMDANPKIGMMGPKLLNSDGTVQYSCYRFDFWSIFIKPFRQIGLDKKFTWAKNLSNRLEMKDWDHAETRPVDWVMGSAMVARKAVTDKVGWFDDRYFMYMEDSDWCRRMWEAGWPVYYVHDIVITHKHARESAKVPGVLKALFKNRLARIHLKSWAQYIWKWKNNFKYYAHKA